MKILILLVLFALNSAQQLSDVKITYDKFDDSTAVVMYRVPLGRGEIGWLPSPMGVRDPDQLELTLIDSFKGRTRPPRNQDDPVHFVISSSRGLGLSSAPVLTLLIDGERITMGTEWQLDPISRQPDMKAVRIRLNYGLLSKVANSKAAEGKLGITEFNFPSRVKSDIQTFIQAVAADAR